MTSNNDFMKNAQQHLRQAEKKSKGGWLSKPEWFLAAAEYDNAANAFNMGGFYEKATECWAKSAEANNKDGNYYQAAMLYEKAANVLYKKLKDPVKAADYLQNASHYFRLKDSADRAAKALEMAGDMVSEIDPNEAAKLFIRSAHILKDENRGRLALETYYKVLSFLVLHSKKRDASELRDIIIDTCKQLGRENRNDTFIINKCYLSLIILALYSKDLKDAEQKLQEFEVEGRAGIGFNNNMSREYEAARKLFETYKNREADEFRQTLANTSVLIAYPSVAKLAGQIEVRAGGIPGDGPVPATTVGSVNSNYNPFKPISEDNDPVKSSTATNAVGGGVGGGPVGDEDDELL
ncbi:hypothetical protein H4219_005491 [Mycoemilia scoparia]|uniref:Gamma-soluble NSF attachment protein n=1 Tax=Mycoemilia scoparia TaxID=417184 RepID=A0A9W8DPF1_9FUNG|nr:hypothetical protein H4219_005491 [Mycoemilia scoparia]